VGQGDVDAKWWRYCVCPRHTRAAIGSTRLHAPQRTGLPDCVMPSSAARNASTLPEMGGAIPERHHAERLRQE
jgi:hypothetical protein